MFDITISPPTTELILKKGAKFTQAYQIKNNSKQTIYLSTSVKQWQPTDNTGTISYLDYNSDQINFKLNNADLKLGQNFYIEPNQEKQIVLSLSSLNTAPDQDYYFTLFLNQIDPGGLNSTALGQIGSHILISSSTNMSTQASADIKKIQITPKIKDVFLNPISFQIDLQNQSQNFFKAEGKLIIQKGNKTIKELDIAPQNILANSSHLLNCLNNDQSIPCTISPPFWPGPYTVNLKLSSEVNYTSPPHTFFVLPYSIFAVTLFILSLVFLSKKLKKSTQNP